MITFLLLFLAQDQVQATPRNNVAALKQELNAVRSELKAATDAVAASRIREAQRDKDLSNAIEEIKKEREKSSTLQSVATTDVIPLMIAGLRSVDSPAPVLQWRIFHAHGCTACPTVIRDVLALNGRYTVGSDANAQFRLCELTSEAWRKSGVSLPRAELWDGNSYVKLVEAPISVQALTVEYDKLMNLSNVVGVKVGTLPVKATVETLLKEFEPFLDGGTLNVSYTARPGVIKDRLTISHGSFALRIAPKTSATFGMDNKRLIIKFDSPTPEVYMPIRGNTSIKSFTLSPSSFSVQLPWMLDPEVTFTEGGFTATNKPQMEIDEEINGHDHDEQLYGEPRSGHWPSVRNAYNKTHPFCEACGSPDNGNVHHVVPFHDNPDLECDPNNLIRLCRDCHFIIGHERNWKNSNPNVRTDAAAKLSSIKGRSNPK